VPFNKCSSNSKVTKPYPASKPGSAASLEVWSGCSDGVEIRLLTIAGKGHWYSMDEAVSVNTSVEIWNFVKQYSLDGASITPSIEVPTNRDSVFNGSFSDSLKLAGWTLQQHSGEGSLKLTEGKAEINVTKTGTNAYDVQMIQNGVHYEKGQSYKVTFDAYASVARTLEVNIEKDTDPWTSYLGEAKTFDLGTEKKNFEILFTMNEATDENGRVSFNAGLATGSVFIDNVVLSKVEGTLGLAKNVRVLTGERTLSVYDMNGAFICNLKGVRVNDVQSKLNSMKLEKGLYVVKNGSFSRIYSVK
jgi:hypothetical protein